MPVDKDGRHYTTEAGLRSLCHLWGLDKLIAKADAHWDKYFASERGKAELARTRAKMDANGGTNV